MKIKRLLHQMTALLCAAALMAGVPAAAASADTVKVSAKNRQFTLYGIPSGSVFSPIRDKNNTPNMYKGEPLNTHTVQNFAFSPDNQYIFTTAQCDNTKGLHTLLCCLEVPSPRGSSAYADFKAYTILDNYGHGETLAVTSSSASGAYDVWVYCDPVSNLHGVNIMRLTCKIKNNGKIKIKKQVKLNLDGVALCGGTYSRDRLGIAVNQGANKIAFRIETTNSGTFYEIYDFQKLNKLLNKCRNLSTFSMSSIAAKSLLQADIRCNVRPYSSFQSFDVDGNYLYICGGNATMGAQIAKVKYTSARNGAARPQTLSTPAQTIDIKPQIKIGTTTYGINEMEIEGMKIQNIRNSSKVNYYINFYTGGKAGGYAPAIRDTIGIYKFKK